ncbi:hypothetical protein YC2023_018262 [Brassica napus]
MFSDGTDAKESHATDSVMLLLPSSSSLLYVNLMLTEADDLEPGEIRNDDSVNVNIEANLVVVEDDSKDPADKNPLINVNLSTKETRGIPRRAS